MAATVVSCPDTYTQGQYWLPSVASSASVCLALLSATSFLKMDVDFAEYEEAVDEAVSEIVGEVVHILSEELKDILIKNRSCWVKEWVGRRSVLGASATLLEELAKEDPTEYRKVMRISVDQFNKLLSLIEHEITKRDTPMRDAISAKVKLEIALRYLATGDSYQSLSLIFRVPATTISQFMPPVLKAIVNALQDYLKVKYCFL